MRNCWKPTPVYLLLLGLFLILLLFLRLLSTSLLENGSSNSVEISPEGIIRHVKLISGMNSHAVLTDLSSSIRSSLKYTDLLKGLNDSSLNTSSGITVVTWSYTSSVLGTVEFGESTDTDGFSEVDVSSDGSWEG